MMRHMSRRSFAALAGTALGSVLLAGCTGLRPHIDGPGFAQDGDELPDRPLDASSPQADEPSYEVDYGKSKLYSKDDMNAAIETIMYEFDGWGGCTMKRISYAGDKTSSKQVAYCNELRDESEPEFDEAIVFTTLFHSPSAEESEGTAWESDTDYDGFTWYLARSSKGPWELMTCGYG